MLTDPDGYRIELVQWPPGHPEGMTRTDLGGQRGARGKEVVAEMLHRQQAGDDAVLDDLVAQHLTLSGTHRGSSMPLLSGTQATGRPVTWTFIHVWRVSDGLVVEHWACRDDKGLLEQVRDD